MSESVRHWLGLAAALLVLNTGLSFHNHLHFDIRQHETQPDPMKDPIAAGATPQADLDDFTIPFVFREVTNIIGTDGVCKSLKYYTSENERQDC